MTRSGDVSGIHALTCVNSLKSICDAFSMDDGSRKVPNRFHHHYSQHMT